MFARLDRKEIDRHFTYALSIVQANVHVRDLIEKAFSEQLRRDGVTLRRSGPSAHPAATDQIVELRDQGLNWAEVAEQVGMTRSGAWSRYRRAHQPASPRLGRWQQVLADALHQNLAIGVRAAVADHLGRAPTRAELNAARRAAHSLAALGRAQVMHVPGAEGNDDAGDRTYLVLAKPNVIMNDVRLRGLAVAGSDAAGRKNFHNHAQTIRNLRHSLRNAAAGARLVQAEGLYSESAADVAASLSDALEELHRLQRSVDRRIRRDQGRRDGSRPETGNKRNRASAASWSIH